MFTGNVLGRPARAELFPAGSYHDPAMKKKLLFIHGMFLTGKSWEHWVPYFEQRGYDCVAPSWPRHENDPAHLRAHVDPGLGELALETVTSHFAKRAGGLDAPILVGHSLGGLIAQKLVERQLAAAAVCISSVAPNAMVSLDWGFFRNSLKITNPLKGSQPFPLTPEGFQQNFANTLSSTQSLHHYERYAVPESRNVLRDAMGQAGHLDLAAPHVPLLFIGGDRDQIIPDKLNRRNAEAYTDRDSVAAFKEFPGRGHFICGEPGWEEVAGYVADWLQQHGLGPHQGAAGARAAAA